MLLTFTALSAKAVLPFPAIAVRLGQSAAWLLLLLIGAGAAALSLLTARLLERHPGRGLSRLAEDLAGPVAGTALNLVLLAWLLSELALVMRLFTETFITAILPNTPPSVVGGVILAMVLYAAHAGLEPVSRTNLILVPLIAIAFVAVLLANANNWKWDWLFPLWGPGPAALTSTAVQFLGYGGEIVLIAVHGYALRDPGLFRRAALPGLGLAFAALAATMAVLVMCFGVVAAELQPFPMYSLARLVYLGRFFQRSEAVFVLFWALTAMSYLALVLHGAAVTAGGMLAVPHYRPLLFPLGLVAYAFSLLPRNFHEAMLWNQQLHQVAALVAFGIPAVLLVLSLARGSVRAAPPGAGPDGLLLGAGGPDARGESAHDA